MKGLQRSGGISQSQLAKSLIDLNKEDRLSWRPPTGCASIMEHQREEQHDQIWVSGGRDRQQVGER